MAEKNLPSVNGNKQVSTKGVWDEVKDLNGIIDVKGSQQFLVNMGGKPYMDKGGLSLKLQQIANKRGGIKSVLSIPISYAHESPEEMAKFLNLPAQILEKVFEQRDYDMGAFTTPEGTALCKCVIIFGNGLKVSETATANKANVKMSTIHDFLDVMAATRAYNRCIKKITAQGFMSSDLVDEDEYEYKEENFADDDIPFPSYEEGAEEGSEMGEGEK